MRTLFRRRAPGAARALSRRDRHGIVQVAQYWDFDYPTAASGDTARSDAEYIAEFRAALDEAVRIRLRADVPVGCYLSGGLDSCAVLGLAARHHPEPIRAFTLTFEHEPTTTKAPSRRRWRERRRDSYHPIPIRQQDAGRPLQPTRIHHAETLCVNAHGVAKYLLSRAVRDAGYKVVLTGEGSDEDPRRLPALSPRHAALRQRGPGPGRRRGNCSKWLDRPATRCPAGLSARRTARSVPSTACRRVARLRAVLDRDLLASRASARCSRCSGRTSAPAFGGRGGRRRAMLDDIDVPRPAHGPRAREPVALPVGEDGALPTTS